MVVADSSRATGMQFLVQTGKDRWSIADVSSIATGVHGLALKGEVRGLSDRVPEPAEYVSTPQNPC